MLFLAGQYLHKALPKRYNPESKMFFQILTNLNLSKKAIMLQYGKDSIHGMILREPFFYVWSCACTIGSRLLLLDATDVFAKGASSPIGLGTVAVCGFCETNQA